VNKWIIVAVLRVKFELSGLRVLSFSSSDLPVPFAWLRAGNKLCCTRADSVLSAKNTLIPECWCGSKSCSARLAPINDCIFWCAAFNSPRNGMNQDRGIETWTN
jgi:hypothetical protein